MKSKILVLLLVVLALTFVVQVLVTTQSQKAMARDKYVPMCKECYQVCDRPNYGPDCAPDPNRPGCCYHWVEHCFDVPCDAQFPSIQ